MCDVLVINLWSTCGLIVSHLYDRLYTYREIRKNIRKTWKMKRVLRCILCHFFRILRPFFHFLHFTAGSAFIRKVKGFCSLFFCGINKTRNSHEIRKVQSECFVFRGVFHENTSEISAKCEIGKVYSQPNCVHIKLWKLRKILLKIVWNFH